MKKEIKKFSQGKVSLGVSFWVWYIIGGGVLSLPFWIIPEAALASEGWAAFMILYFIFMLGVVIFLMTGVWRSAEEYKKIKRKKKTRCRMGYGCTSLYCSTCNQCSFKTSWSCS